MSLFHVIGFGLKVGYQLLMSCCWFLSLISLNLLSKGEVMTTRTNWLGGAGWIQIKLWDLILESFYNFHRYYSQYIGSRKVRTNWWRKLLVAWIGFWIVASVWVFWYMNSQAYEKRKEALASMCDERARMLQDQFNVSMNHIQSMSVLISTFHHGKNPSAIDQVWYIIFKLNFGALQCTVKLV